ncbi:hypothetical protein RND71_028580 [Anisodus tanguticus]|uniref:Uncharacterized protein n=1 Tax=Anisodus tanguticus TaxID=243964 RepID=A0AAE1V2R2_9SOLA|nr:hypothetical protein RND71_028580 [Anisodus tanguticus]
MNHHNQAPANEDAPAPEVPIKNEFVHEQELSEGPAMSKNGRRPNHGCPSSNSLNSISEILSTTQINSNFIIDLPLRTLPSCPYSQLPFFITRGHYAFSISKQPNLKTWRSYDSMYDLSHFSSLRLRIRTLSRTSAGFPSFPKEEYIEAWSLQSKGHSRAPPQLIKISDIVNIKGKDLDLKRQDYSSRCRFLGRYWLDGVKLVSPSEGISSRGLRSRLLDLVLTTKVMTDDDTTTTELGSDEKFLMDVIDYDTTATELGYLRSLMELLIPRCDCKFVQEENDDKKHIPYLKRNSSSSSSATIITGTIFGSRKGKVNFCIQTNPKSTNPILLLELAVSTSSLAREMQKGIVRIALESTIYDNSSSYLSLPLLSMPIWTMYCKGKKVGVAVKRKPTKVDLGV